MTQLEKDEMVEGVGTTAPTGNGNLTEIERQHQRRVLSKFDMFVMPQMSILVLFAYLDRTNIGISQETCTQKNLPTREQAMPEFLASKTTLACQEPISIMSQCFFIYHTSSSKLLG